MDIPTHSFGGDQIRGQRTIARSIYFALMSDFGGDLNFGRIVPQYVITLVILIQFLIAASLPLELLFQWDFDVRYEQSAVVFLVSVRSNETGVLSVVVK